MDRFFTIRFPLKYGRNKTRKYMLLKILLVWAISVFICFPMFTLGYINEKNVFNRKLKECALEHSEFKIYGSIFAFYIPLLLIAITYIFTMKALNNLVHAKQKYEFLNGNHPHHVKNIQNGKIKRPQANKVFNFFKTKYYNSFISSSSGTTSRKYSSVSYRCNPSIFTEKSNNNFLNCSTRTKPDEQIKIDNIIINTATQELKAKNHLTSIQGNLLNPNFEPSMCIPQRRTCSFNESYLSRRDYNNDDQNVDSNGLIVQKYFPQRKIPPINRKSLQIRMQAKSFLNNNNNENSTNTFEIEKILQKYFSETNLILKFNKKSVNVYANENRPKKTRSYSFKSKSDFHLFLKKCSKSNVPTKLSTHKSLLNFNNFKFNSKSTSRKLSAIYFNGDEYKFRFSLKLKSKLFKRSSKNKIEESKKLQKIFASIERDMDNFLESSNKENHNTIYSPGNHSIIQMFPSSYTAIVTSRGNLKNNDKSGNNNKKHKLKTYLMNLINKNEIGNFANKMIPKHENKYLNGFLNPNENAKFQRPSVTSNITSLTDSTNYISSHKNSLYSINYMSGNEIDRKNSRKLIRNKSRNSALIFTSSNSIHHPSSYSLAPIQTGINGKKVSIAQKCARHSAGNLSGKSLKEINSQLSGFSKANNERKAVKVLIIIFVIFVALWTPFFVVNTLSVFCFETCKPLYSLMGLFTWLGYISSSINPIIYTVFNKSFRKTFIALLTCKSEFFDLKQQRLKYDCKYNQRRMGLVDLGNKCQHVQNS